MGLDILIETKNSKERKTCNLSRQFCHEMISQSENEESIINQILKLFKSEEEILNKINVWDLEEKFHTSSNGLKKESIEIRYKEAWQGAKKLQNWFLQLKNQINSNKKKLEELKYENELQKKYYLETDFRIEGIAAKKNLRFDIEKIITFLEELSEDDKIKFHYF